MVTKPDSNKARLKRHKRVRGKISGTAERPRLCVYRSLNNMLRSLTTSPATRWSLRLPMRRLSRNTAEIKTPHAKSAKSLPSVQQRKTSKQ